MFIQKGQILWVFVAVTFKTTLFCPKNHDPSYGNIRPFLMHPNAGFLLGLKTGWFWKVHDILTVFLGWIKLLEASIPAPLSCCFLALLRGRVFTRWCGFSPALGGKILGLTKSHQDEMVLFQTYVYIYMGGYIYKYIHVFLLEVKKYVCCMVCAILRMTMSSKKGVLYHWERHNIGFGPNRKPLKVWCQDIV